MFGLSHLFYPWGFIVQIVALIHFVRRRPENYWFYIILFGGFVGSAAYLVVEAVPDLGLLRGVFQGFGRRTRIQKLETDILDNPSAANFEELGELYLDEKKFEKSREAFTKAIGARSDSSHTFYLRGKASVGLGDFAGAIPDLESLSAATTNSITTAPQRFSQTPTRTLEIMREPKRCSLNPFSSRTRRRRFTTTRDS